MHILPTTGATMGLYIVLDKNEAFKGEQHIMEDEEVWL